MKKNIISLSRNPVLALVMILTLTQETFIDETSLSRRNPVLALVLILTIIKKRSNTTLFTCRNPVLALVLILTISGKILGPVGTTLMSQSSISPGIDSDHGTIGARPKRHLHCRNPVLALVLILTITIVGIVIHLIFAVAIQY